MTALRETLELPGSVASVVGALPTTTGPGSTPKVLGLDLSLSGTGVAGDGWADTIRFPARRKSEDRTDYCHRRLAHIRSALLTYLNGVELAVIEGLAFSMRTTGMDQLSALSWMVRHMLWQRNIPYALVSPTSLKLYAIGKGKRSAGQIEADNAEGKAVKDPTLAAVRGWFGWFDGDDNAADACVLHAMGRDHLGAPVVAVPEAQRASLARCEWPELAQFGGAA